MRGKHCDLEAILSFRLKKAKETVRTNLENDYFQRERALLAIAITLGSVVDTLVCSIGTVPLLLITDFLRSEGVGR